MTPRQYSRICMNSIIHPIIWLQILFTLFIHPKYFWSNYTHLEFLLLYSTSKPSYLDHNLLNHPISLSSRLNPYDPFSALISSLSWLWWLAVLGFGGWWSSWSGGGIVVGLRRLSKVGCEINLCAISWDGGRRCVGLSIIIVWLGKSVMPLAIGGSRTYHSWGYPGQIQGIRGCETWYWRFSEWGSVRSSPYYYSECL
jgi:hypothetical protein